MNAVFVIAEAGVNHNGQLDMALELVAAAAAAGADAVKFQTFRAQDLATAAAPKAGYQVETTGAGQNQLEMLRRLELGRDEHVRLLEACRQHGIEFMSSAFDLKSLAFLDELGCRRVKVPSGEVTNVPYLRAVAACAKPVILSTGMCDLDEVRHAVATLEAAGLARERLTILHCNTEYPTPMTDVNLRAMVTLGKTFGVRYGNSDHTPGIEIPIAATALGATVIEKHLTLDRALPGPDHRASLEPTEFGAMVGAIRNVGTALGSADKTPSASELPNRAIGRRSIVAATGISAGERFDADNLTTKRPGTGLAPTHWDALLGRTARRSYGPDEMIDAGEID